jgi:ribosome-associated toxin RatA of RatAB toxin-antitoxin module
MSKVLNELILSIWKRDEHTIALTVKNSVTGEEFISTVECTDKRKGRDMARTHDNLFNKLKSMLVNNNKWDN